MSYPDSMFLFEITVVELKSFTDCKEFYIKSKFADVFTLTLKDPNDVDPLVPTVKKKKRISKVRHDADHKPPAEGKVQSGQSMLFTCPINSLLTSMKNYPIEISLYNKDEHIKKMGSVHIPWSPVYIEYLCKVGKKANATPIQMRGSHNVYDDSTSKRIAIMTISTKLTHLKDKVTSFGRSLAVPNSTMHARLASNPQSIKNKELSRLVENTGTIKTVYPNGKRKSRSSIKLKVSNKEKEKPTKGTGEKLNIEPVTRESKDFNLHSQPIVFTVPFLSIEEEDNIIKPSPKIVELSDEDISEVTLPVPPVTRVESLCERAEIFPSILLVKSSTNIIKNLENEVVRTKSCSFIDKQQFNFLNYVFGAGNRPVGNRVLYVGYFTVDHNFEDGSSSKVSSAKSSPPKTSEPSEPGSGVCDCPKGNPQGSYTFKICDKHCSSRKDDGKCSEIICLKKADLDADALLTLVKCDRLRCDDKEMRILPPPPPDTIHLDMSSMHKECCVDDMSGGVKTTAKMKYDEKDKTCYCECECTFGFVKRTTYCGICGGYERIGDDMPTRHMTAPFPCPIYHKLVDKNKQQKSTSGSDRSKMGDSKGSNKKQTSKSQVSPGPTPLKTPAAGTAATEVESDREYCKKKRKERRDDRFKFNYGYTAPQIGHSRCGMPCTGTLNAVPKHMGWLWTAEDVPGMKFRPSWKPGCVHKHVLRLLRCAKDPGIILAKKKKKDMGKKKKPLKRPLLTVAKKDGEYTVTMETMKSYAKPRAINQQPYEDKPVLTYTIGRTEEENRERQKRKERAFRRLQRDQRDFIQSAFTDMCKDICLKTYQQALGFLPNTEEPDCFCFPNAPGADETNLDRSCSCSEDDVSFGTDSDSDEWLVEFTPPIAQFDPTFKGKKITKIDAGSQYNYLDYRVKLLDRSGNQVPRFFKGPDGKTQCSDLGGFWSADHKWLEINNDGFIAPDGRWAPLTFIGPHGDQIECDTGKFQDTNGQWLVVGVDGYVDNTGRWRFYPHSKNIPPKKKRPEFKKGAGDKKGDNTPYKGTESTWSCFGDANPKQLSKLGILGHGHDKRLLKQTLQEMIAHGEDVKIPEASMIPMVPGSKRGKRKPASTLDSFYSDRSKCKHSVPSDKGIVAVDGRGNKTFFRLKEYANKRPHDRMAHLKGQGRSLSSFHVPCLSSFINAEMMKKQQYERFLRNKSAKYDDMEYGVAGNTFSKNAATQYRYRYAI